MYKALARHPTPPTAEVLRTNVESDVGKSCVCVYECQNAVFNEILLLTQRIKNISFSLESAWSAFQSNTAFNLLSPFNTYYSYIQTKLEITGFLGRYHQLSLIMLIHNHRATENQVFVFILLVSAKAYFDRNQSEYAAILNVVSFPSYFNLHPYFYDGIQRSSDYRKSEKYQYLLEFAANGKILKIRKYKRTSIVNIDACEINFHHFKITLQSLFQHFHRLFLHLVYNIQVYIRFSN